MESVVKVLIQMFGLPDEFFPTLWLGICQEIKQATGGLDLTTLRPVDHCEGKTHPVLFIQSVDDKLIPKENTEQNF